VDKLQQSPINININRAIRATVPQGYFQPKWEMAHGREHQGEHGVEVFFQADPNIGLTLDGKWYTLRSYHFHLPSEHFLEGRQADGEVHIVHQNPDDGAVAVIGVLLKVKSDNGQEEYHQATEKYRKEVEKYREATTQGYSLPTNPTDFIPCTASGAHQVFRYQGSLTTEPYTEPVAWIVFKDLLVVSSDLIKQLDPPGPSEPQHARPVQPLHGRLVLAIDISVDKADTGKKSIKDKESTPSSVVKS
jgi:carbonic anhydrase